MTGEDVAPDVARAARQISDGESVVDCVAIRIRKDDRYWRVTERLRSDGAIVDDKGRVYRARVAA